MQRNLKWPPMLAFAAFAMAASITSLVAISPALGTGAEGITTFSGSTAGAVAYSSNSSTGSAIEGVTGTVAGGKAVWGVANNALNAGTGVRATAFGPSSFGLYAEAINTNKAKPSYGLYATSKSSYAVYAFTNVPGLTSLLAYNSDATSNGSHALRAQSRGDAITALSTNNNGIVGQTNATPTPMPSIGFARAGVLGQDTTTSAYNAGVAGTSTNGNGVVGHALIGTPATPPSFAGNAGVLGLGGESGVIGLSTSGYGVVGNSDNGFGVSGDSHSGAAVAGYSDQSNGVLAYSAATPNPSPAPGCCGSIAALLVYSAGGAPLIVANYGGTHKMSLDASGNMILAGTLTQSGSPLVVHRTLSGRTVGAYSAQQSVQTIEDTGEAQLVNGQSYVRLDPAFAETIDPRANYLVFITPQGQSQGWLYVTQKTRSGFVVRESQGGRSNLAFDYRIVAKPLDSNGRRLPLINLPAPGVNPPRPRPVTLPLPRNQTRP